MVAGGASMAISSITSWFTPTVLFCVLNLMIAIIFIASNFKSPNPHDHHPQNLQGQLVRTPSLLERVKSVNFSSFYATPESHETIGYNSMSQLSRPPSFLQRVKSIDLSFSSYYTVTPPVNLQSHDSHEHDSEQTRHDSPGQLTRVPSLLERVKSFKLPSPFNSDHQSGETSVNEDEHSDVDRRDPHREPVQDHNESKTSDVIPAKKRPTSITKSRSEKRMPESDDDDKEDVDLRRPATMKASIGGNDECVDAKADDFIKRFKQQLKLQRLESLQRFREMLNRGTSA